MGNEEAGAEVEVEVGVDVAGRVEGWVREKEVRAGPEATDYAGVINCFCERWKLVVLTMIVDGWNELNDVGKGEQG